MRAMHTATMIAAGLLWLGASGCDSSKSAGPAKTSAPGATAQSSAAGGTVHKPPVAKAEVPDGHYYCDMGTVHYSRAHQGDGKCPLCKMDLTKK